MFDLLRIRQARRAAYSALEPFVHRTSINGPDPRAGDWLQPQILGFLATAVTLIAMRRHGRLPTHALAAVQSNVLHALTGIGPELIGEEICLLSSRSDPAFAAGSVGAVAFLEAMLALPSGTAAPSREFARSGLDPGVRDCRALDELWDEHVERYLRKGQAFG